MIEFRQKIFVAGAVAGIGKILSSNALMGGTMVGGMVQSSNQAKQQAKQNEEMMEQQQRLQKQTQKALEKVADSAKKDSSKAGAVVDVMQRSYSIPVAKLGTALKNGGQTVYEFGRILNNSNGGNQIIKKVGTGLAMGTTMAAGGYLVDKAIQADRKKITGGTPLPQPQEDPKKKSKGIKKAVTGAALVAGSVLAARKGYLGKGFKNLSHGLNNASQKINKTDVLKDLGKEYKKGFKEQFITKDPATGKNKLNKFGTAMTLGFAGMGGMSYLGERKQLKEQARAQGEQKQYSENYQYQVEQKERKRGSALKKLAIGTAATIGTVATLRRVGPVGLRKNINDMYMTYGKQIAGKSGNKLGNWMMKSGAEQYGKAVKAGADKAIAAGKKAAAGGGFRDKLPFIGRDEKQLQAIAQRGKLAERANIDAVKAGEARLKRIQSGKAGRKLGQGVLDGIGGIFGFGKKQRAGVLNEALAKDPKTGKFIYSEGTTKTAEFLRKHKRTAAVGGIAIGSLAFKPFEWGDKAVRGVTKAVDKDAFAYEKSKEQQV